MTQNDNNVQNINVVFAKFHYGLFTEIQDWLEINEHNV